MCTDWDACGDDDICSGHLLTACGHARHGQLRPRALVGRDVYTGAMCTARRRVVGEGQGERMLVWAPRVLLDAGGTRCGSTVQSWLEMDVDGRRLG